MPESTAARAWEGRPRPAAFRWLAITRAGLGLLGRKKLFWPLYVLCLLNFAFHFACIYLAAHVAARQEAIARMAAPFLRRFLSGGEGGPYYRFMMSQAFMVMLILAFAGAGIIGEDRRQGALLFYLSKPIARRHYLLGKLGIVFTVASLVTTIPALVLFIEFGLLAPTWDYLTGNVGVVGSIVAYGSLVSLVVGVLMLALSSLLRRAAAILAAWTAIFAFSPSLRLVVKFLGAPRDIRHLDLWWNLRTMGGWLFGMSPLRGSPELAGIVLGAVLLASAIVLAWTVRAVEVSR